MRQRLHDTHRYLLFLLKRGKKTANHVHEINNDLSPAQVRNGLEKLVGKGLAKRDGYDITQPTRRASRFYQITPQGEEALETTEEPEKPQEPVRGPWEASGSDPGTLG